MINININESDGLFSLIVNENSYLNKVNQWKLKESLEYLHRCDDLDITINNDPSLKLRLRYKPNLLVKHKTKMFDHQIDGVLYGLDPNHSDFLLLDDPGLGKTLQMIYLAEELKEQKGLEHCLIICGINSLKANWEEEIHKHSNETVRVLGKKINRKGNVTYASVKERAAELMNPMDAFFIVTNIETIRSDEVVDALKKTKNKIGMVVLDEAHKIKNPSSQQGHNLLKLTNYKHKIALTGTLIVNNPLDAYAALKWIGVEHATLTNFKAQYCEFGGFGGYQIVGFKNIDILKNEIADCSLRRLKSDLKDLPPKTVIPEFLDMEDSHRKFYDNVKDGVKEECDKIELKANNVLALTTRLRQASTAPSMLTSNPITSTKIERAIELVDDLIANGEKVVIMSVFKEPLLILYDRLKRYKPVLGTGDVSDDIFDKNKKLFQEDPNYKVFLGTVSKAGTGLTLNAASYLICLDQPWTAALQTQVEDRIHRVNNTEPVFIYKLICKGTIDEVVNQLVESKAAISEYVIDDKINENSIDILRKYIQNL